MYTNRLYIRVISIAAALFIASCGGGSSTGSNPNDALVPQNPPAAASPIYSGNQSPATITETNALDFGLASQRGLDLAASMSLELIQTVFQGVMYSKTSDVLTQGRINADGTGWILTTYTQHNVPSISVSPYLANDLNPVHLDLVINGQVLVQYLSGSSTSNQNFTISFYNFNIKGAQINVTLNGTLNSSLVPEETGSPPAIMSIINANMSMKDNTSNENWLFSNYSINSTVIGDLDPPTSDVVVSGKIFSASDGYAQVSTPGVHLRYFYTLGELGPFTGGYIKLQGGSGAAYFGEVNYHFASVAVDPNNAGYPTEAQRYSWANNAPDVTPASWTNGPVAYASLLQVPYVGSPGVLDGRFSYSPSGGFITFTWSILLGPPGGNAQLTNPQSPTPSFSADQSGQYLVKLQVSDGQNTASDYEVVSVPPTPGPTGALAGGSQIQSLAGPSFIQAQLGQPVQLDGRIHTTVETTSVGTDDLTPGGQIYNWTLDVPNGSQASLNNSSSVNPSFVPDVNGYYVVTLGENVRTIVDVGEGFKFSPPMQFLAATQLSTADLFGTGRKDIVASMGTYTAVYPNAGNGVYQSGITLPGNDGIAIGDLNDDGRPDIVSALNYGYADILLQQPNEQFSLTQSLCDMSGSCTEETGGAQVWIQNIGSSTTPSVIATASADNGLDIFSPDGSGGFLPAITIPGPPGFDAAWSVGDVNGDGTTDLVGVVEGNTSAQLFTMSGNPDGSFGTAKIYPDELGGGCLPPEGVSTDITDINNDGRNDVVETGNGWLVIYLQQSDGTLGLPESISLTATACPQDIPAIGDINNDGLNDIATIDGENVRIIMQGSAHNFNSVTEYPVYQAINYVEPGIGQVVITDINGDGIPDLILPSGIVMLGVSYPATSP